MSTASTTSPAAGSQLKALRQEMAEINARVLLLNQKVADKQDLAEAERTELTALRERAVAVKGALDVAEEANDRERELAARADASRRRETADADAAASERAREAAGVRVEVRDRAEDERKQPGFFGRQLQAVLQFAAKGGWAHLSAEEQRVLAPMLEGESHRRVLAAPTGLNTDIASDGGFLVGQDRASGILQRMYSTGQVLQRVSRLPIGPGSNGMKMPAIDETSRADNSRYGGIVSGWLGQGNTLTAGRPKFREIDLKLRKVGAFVYATDEQIADAVALEGWINKYLPLELNFRTEDAVINGTGANQPLGVRNSGAVITVTRNTASRVLYEDVSGMWLRMWAPARTNAVWLVDQSVEAELEQLAIAIGTAGVLAPIYKPAGSQPGQPFATLYGRPVIPVEYCSALGTSGDIVLAALDEYVLIDKGGVDQAVSLHVAFLTHEQVFRFMYRVDGQPTWNAAMTPKSGGSTLSCVVVLS
ncbi:MAG: phage major capsid protein [Vicinamibacterales bacterium]